uniref:Uncharacterized protein n=1 Tax=Avena sativa TaxID=4498 RepID=A0ACD5WHV4_AVESA
MVMELGDRKWAAIAQHLPGRIGKQCRERWTNHLRPDLRKEHIWTEDDDRVLIEAHKIYGNRWSAIARCLPGRSENAVKNHWNATKRSLKSKRRFRKKRSEQQAAPGQLSLLEEYIRSNTPGTAEGTAPPSVSPALSGLGYADPVGPNAAAYELTGSSPPGLGMGMGMGMELYLQPEANVGRSSSYGGTMNLNLPSLPDLNAYGGEMQEGFYYSPPFPPNNNNNNNNLHYGGLQEPLPAPAFPLMMSPQERLQAACMNLNLFPIADQSLASNVEFEGQSSYGGGCYYDSETGPSSGGGGSGDPDDMDVVQMASREFLTPSEDEATLDFTRFAGAPLP